MDRNPELVTYVRDGVRKFKVFNEILDFGDSLDVEKNLLAILAKNAEVALSYGDHCPRWLGRLTLRRRNKRPAGAFSLRHESVEATSFSPELATSLQEGKLVTEPLSTHSSDF